MAFNVITPTKLGQGSIATSLTTRYTTPASTRTMVKDITICNTSTTAAINVSLYLVPSGGSAGVTNIFISNASIPPSGVFQWTGVQIMNAGDFIQDIGSATGCTVNISGGECV